MEKIAPVVKEEHSSEYTGKPYFTLVMYQNNPYIVIVDNYINKTINGFVLDYCEAYSINMNDIINVAELWWNSNCSQPFSIFASQCNLSETIQPIFKTFPEEHVNRAIGPLPIYQMNTVYNIKRRKHREVKNIPIKKANKKGHL